MLITANQPFGEWGSIFPDEAMTLAAVDRLVHRATIFELNVESYRRRTAVAATQSQPRPRRLGAAAGSVTGVVALPAAGPAARDAARISSGASGVAGASAGEREAAVLAGPATDLVARQVVAVIGSDPRPRIAAAHLAVRRDPPPPLAHLGGARSPRVFHERSAARRLPGRGAFAGGVPPLRR